MSPSNLTTNQQINYCAGKECKNKGNRVLMIRYLDKIGYFCEDCANDLLRSELAEEKGGIRDGGV
jgi:hypothetical protein